MGQELSQDFAPMKENSESYSTIKEILQVDNCPFGIVITNKEEVENSFVAIGNKRLTSLISTEECKQLIDSKDWSLTVQLVMHIMENKELIDKINEVSRTQGLP